MSPCIPQTDKPSSFDDPDLFAWPAPIHALMSIAYHAGQVRGIAALSFRIGTLLSIDEYVRKIGDA